MTILATRTRGKHRTSGRQIGQQERDAIEIQRLKARIAELEPLEAQNEELMCAVGRAAIREKGLTERLATMTDLTKKHGDRVIRQEADIARLRQALRNKWHITVADAPLLRPYAAGVPIPYPVPVVGHNTSNDETREMAVLDWPTPIPA